MTHLQDDTFHPGKIQGQNGSLGHPKSGPDAPTAGREPLRRVVLTEEQESAVDRLVAGVDRGERLQTLGGYAGTGKTTIIVAARERLAARGRPVGVMAPTGRAACVLRKKGIDDAGTIHSHIYKPIPECAKEGGTIPGCGNAKCTCRIVGWRRNEVLPFSVAIVDEASMVGRRLYQDLASYGVKIIAVGDHGQLPPVQGPGEEPFSLMSDPQIRLETIHRNAGDIARFAEHLRRGEPAFRFRPRDGTVQICGKDQPVERLPVMTADRVICGKNRTRVGLNLFYRDGKGLTPMGKVVAGETVMCLRNDPDHGLYNGTLARVTKVESGKFDLESEEGTKEGVPYDPEQFGRAGKVELRFGQDLLPFDYGYASTCHKAQGGEWPFVLVVEEYLPFGHGRERGDFSMHHRWCYTAASRAQKKLVWRAGTEVYYPSYDHDRDGAMGGAA